MKDPLAISVRGLHKSYGIFEAVRGIDFEVRTGEVFGLLGPNGAGKTTTVEILEGIRQRTSGDRWIAACFVLGVLLWAFALHGVYRLFH